MGLFFVPYDFPLSIFKRSFWLEPIPKWYLPFHLGGWKLDFYFRWLHIVECLKISFSENLKNENFTKDFNEFNKAVVNVDMRWNGTKLAQQQHPQRTHQQPPPQQGQILKWWILRKKDIKQENPFFCNFSDNTTKFYWILNIVIVIVL